MRLFRFAVTLAAFAVWLPACAPSGRLALRAHSRYLPAEVRPLVYFGMPLAEFQRRNPTARETHALSFRVEYEMDLPGTGLTSVTYYFDRDGDQPLYEILADYRYQSERDRVAALLLGRPNFDGDEWRYDGGDGFTVWAWTFETKLILVGMLPGTEWTE